MALMSDRKDGEKTNDVIGIISSSVHDMKTPLMCISGFADAILDGTVPEEKRDHYLSVIRDEAKRLSLMCDEMLLASKIESGKNKYEKKPFDICEAARRVIISLEERINGKSLEIAFSTERDKIEVLGDENAITRVIYNIVDNAVKFSLPCGAIEISISTLDGAARLCVTNIGENTDDLSRVFEPFYTKDREKGTGLGLFIAKSIVEGHGGRIFAQAEDGGKSVFGFEIGVPV